MRDHKPETPAADAAAVPDGTERSGAAPTVLAVVLVAVVVATGVMTWARLTAQASTRAEGSAPTQLADTSAPVPVPDSIGDRIGVPLIGARNVAGNTALAESCGVDAGAVDSAQVSPERAWVIASVDRSDVPRNAERQFGGGAKDLVAVVCTLQWTGGSWRHAGAAAVSRGRNTTAWLCCEDRGGPVVANVVAVPEGAVWMVEDRDRYAVVYDMAKTPLTGLLRSENNNGAPTSAHVWWLDAQGQIVDETYGVQ